MAERISRRKFLFLAGASTGAVVAGTLGVKELLSSGNGKGKAAVVKNPTAEPTQKPPATETIAPTPTQTPIPTEIPTAVPTAEPTKPPPTPEELKQLFNNAASAIDTAYGGAENVPLEIKNALDACNEKNIPPEIKTDLDRSTYVINSCGGIGQTMIFKYQDTQDEVFVNAVEPLRLFAFAQVDKFVALKILTPRQGEEAKIITKDFFTYK